MDDEEDVRTAFRKTFSAAMPELRLITAASGERGLDVLRTERVDVVITDYRMPGMDGMEFLDRASKIDRRAPRIMLTAYPDVELAQQAVNEQNVVRFLTKPIEADAIVRVVRDVLDSVRARDAQAGSIARQGGREA